MELSPLKIERKQRDYGTKSSAGAAPQRGAGLPVGKLVLLVALAGAGWIFWTPIQSFADRFRLVEVRTLRLEESSAAAVGAIKGTAANGYVVAARRAALSADTPGRVVEMLVTEGSVVEQGQVVARLFADEYRASLRRAEADLAVSQAEVERFGAQVGQARADLSRAQDTVKAAAARVESAEAAVSLARRELARVEELVGKRVATQRELDQVQETFDGADANLRAVRADLEAARSGVAGAEAGHRVAESAVAVASARVVSVQAARDLASATLDKTEVRAPFDGIVVLKDAEVGEVVSPSSSGGSNARGSICTMVDFASLEVQVEVPETNLSAVRVGAGARVFLDAFPGQPLAGRVDRIWPTANRQKASIEVRVTFDERDQRLRPEMGARVVFAAEQDGEPGDGSGNDGAPTATPDAVGPQLLVPENVIVRIAGQDGVFVLERDRVTFAQVALGGRGSGRVAITSGVSAGDMVVVDAPARLQDGDRVRVSSE